MLPGWHSQSTMVKPARCRHSQARSTAYLQLVVHRLNQSELESPSRSPKTLLTFSRVPRVEGALAGRQSMDARLHWSSCRTRVKTAPIWVLHGPSLREAVISVTQGVHSNAMGGVGIHSCGSSAYLDDAFSSEGLKWSNATVEDMFCVARWAGT